MINVTFREYEILDRMLSKSESKSDFVNKVSKSRSDEVRSVYKREFNSDVIELSKFAEQNIIYRTYINLDNIELETKDEINEEEVQKILKKEIENINVSSVKKRISFKDIDEVFNFRKLFYTRNTLRVTYHEDRVTEEEKVKYADIRMTDEERDIMKDIIKAA